MVERAFGRLKGTWRILSRTMFRPDPERVEHMIFACCLLHNIIIEQNDTTAMNAIEPLDAHDPQYSTYITKVLPSEARETLRDKLAAVLWQQGHDSDPSE